MTKQTMLTMGLLCLIAAPPTQAKPPSADVGKPTAPLRPRVPDSRLHVPASDTQMVEIWGCEKLWYHLTGIECLQGMRTRNRHLISLLVRAFRFTDQKKMRYDDPSIPPLGQLDNLTIRFQTEPLQKYTDVTYSRQGKTTDVITELSGTTDDDSATYRGPLRPGYSRRFETLIRRLARRAHHHDPAIKIVDLYFG